MEQSSIDEQYLQRVSSTPPKQLRHSDSEIQWDQIPQELTTIEWQLTPPKQFEKQPQQRPVVEHQSQPVVKQYLTFPDTQQLEPVVQIPHLDTQPSQSEDKPQSQPVVKHQETFLDTPETQFEPVVQFPHQETYLDTQPSQSEDEPQSQPVLKRSFSSASLGEPDSRRLRVGEQPVESPTVPSE